MAGSPVTAREVADLTAWLRDIGGRMARWEPVDPEEVAAFRAAAEALTGRAGAGR